MIMSKKQSSARFPLTSICYWKKVTQSTGLQFVITGFFEIESTYFKQVEKDSAYVTGLFQYIGVQAGGNILSIRQLGKIAKKHTVNTPSSQ